MAVHDHGARSTRLPHDTAQFDRVVAIDGHLGHGGGERPSEGIASGECLDPVDSVAIWGDERRVERVVCRQRKIHEGQGCRW